MGYTTHFSGEVAVSPPLNADELRYLQRFSGSRRMARGKGPFYAEPGDNYGQDHAPDITDYNAPDPSQPGLWCKWVPTESGEAIVWDEGEKFYDSEEWMRYLIDTFLKPGCVVEKLMEDGQLSDEIALQFADFTFDHVCNGTIEADGEDPDDRWLIVVEDNVVYSEEGTVVYEGERTKESRALAEIAAGVPREDEWRSAADFMESVATVLDRYEIPRPFTYGEDAPQVPQPATYTVVGTHDEGGAPYVVSVRTDAGPEAALKLAHLKHSEKVSAHSGELDPPELQVIALFAGEPSLIDFDRPETWPGEVS